MTRRFGTGRLGGRKGGEEDINPMDGVANLTDVMLVFACGLMVSLIYFFNVDIQNTSGYVNVDVGTELEDVGGASSNDSGSGDSSDLVEMGKVYQASDGKYYMFIDKEDE